MVAPPAMSPVDELVDVGNGVLESVQEDSAVASGPPAHPNQDTDVSDRGTQLQASRVERLISSEVNAERRERGRSNISPDSRLRDIARYHSRDMAESGYFAHDSPRGETLADRFGMFDYDCRVRLSASAFSTGAENIARISAPYGRFTPSELAREIVQGWLASEGHYKNMMVANWNNQGVGVAITEASGGIEVYATQVFC